MYIILFVTILIDKNAKPKDMFMKYC